MTVRRPNRRAWGLLTATSLLMLTAAGCTQEPHTLPSSTPPSISPTASTQQSSTTSPIPRATASTAESAAVIKAYQGMWADMVDAARTANYRSPSLAAHTIDPATGQLRRTLLTFHQTGWVVKGSVMTNPTVIQTLSSEDPEHAWIVDCLDETHWLTYYAATDKLTDDKPGQRHQISALVRRMADSWKVESFTIAAGGSC